MMRSTFIVISICRAEPGMIDKFYESAEAAEAFDDVIKTDAASELEKWKKEPVVLNILYLSMSRV